MTDLMKHNIPSLEEAILYIEKNWHNLRQHWAKYCLQDLRLFNNYTNNRVEGTNSALKRINGKNQTLTDVIKILFTYMNQQANAKTFREFQANNKTNLPFDIDSIEDRDLHKIGGEFLMPDVDL